jgi:UDP-N-acetylmuramoyl-L-alanyl-D-glutamate--2,6-diaminopimelate ligase
MTLRDLLYGVTAEPVAPVPVSGLACHSKQVRPGDLFVALEGPTSDGHAFIEEAIARGAAAVVAQRSPMRSRAGWALPPWRRADRSVAPTACPCVVVPDTKAALVRMAARFYGEPARKLRLIGVTGTNGKTTTACLIQRILETAGERAGLLGTIRHHIGERAVPSTNTTPGPLELARYFAQMVSEGLGWCVMEVSSHALAQGRVEGLAFEAAVFTNLGSDHLDYHKTHEAYADAKRHLFDLLEPEGLAVLNADDGYGRILAETIPNRRIVTCAIEHSAKVTAPYIRCSSQGTSVTLVSPWGIVPIETPLLGRHNVWNIAAAAATLLPLGISADAIRQALSDIEPIPGRLEPVPNDVGVQVLVDYAHTAEAMRLVLLSLREFTRGRLIVVFGCGGDRDPGKRPAMGRMAALLADDVVLTSDNPRSEHPLVIIRQIKRGMPSSFHHVQAITDREQAILTALDRARPDDTVLIAGKGHEAYQVFHDVSVPFSDREVVERWAGGRAGVAVASALNGTSR